MNSFIKAKVYSISENQISDTNDSVIVESNSSMEADTSSLEIDKSSNIFLNGSLHKQSTEKIIKQETISSLKLNKKISDEKSNEDYIYIPFSKN